MESRASRGPTLRSDCDNTLFLASETVSFRRDVFKDFTSCAMRRSTNSSFALGALLVKAGMPEANPDNDAGMISGSNP
jgi:hypothetical protein